jgi:hypothetical protein
MFVMRGVVTVVAAVGLLVVTLMQLLDDEPAPVAGVQPPASSATSPPLSTTTTTTGLVVVPQLLGLSVGDAVDVAAVAGLDVFVDGGVHDPDDIVTSQEPSPGAETQSGTAIQVGVTAAPESTAWQMFVPPTETSGGRTVMPVVFPDGTRVELSFPADLDLTSHGLAPYSSGRIPGFERDFFIGYGPLEEVADEYSWELLDTYLDSAGETVGFYRLPDDEVDYLAFQFENWLVLVYDYRLVTSGPRMTDEDRAMWVENFLGTVTDEGFLILEATPPVTLAQEGDHAGPELSLGGSDNGLTLYLADCQSTDDPEHTREDVNWCDETSGIRIMASGSSEFMERIVSELEIRR